MVAIAGDWFLEAPSASLGKIVQYTIRGSDASDGTYSGNNARAVGRVSGKRWTLTMEVLDEASMPPSWRQQKISQNAEFTLEKGLLMRLTGTSSETRIVCQSLDPRFQPRINPFDFTVSSDALVSDKVEAGSGAS